MLYNNLKLSFRNLGRNKLYTFINLCGLSIAGAFCIFTYWYVKNEWSFDNFHHDQDRLFRIEQSNIFNTEPVKVKTSFFSSLLKDSEEKNMIQTPVVLAEDLKANLPEIESTVRIRNLYDPIVKANNNSFREKGENAAYADANFFKVFNFPLIYGNPALVLADPHQIVISERAAKKYFGNAALALGKTLEFPNDKMVFTVGSVARDFPLNSSFQFDIVIPRTADPFYAQSIKGGTNSFNDLLIIKLKKGVDAQHFRKSLDAFGKKYYQPLVDRMGKSGEEFKNGMHVYMRPLHEAHYNQSSGWNHYTSLANIYQFICLSIIILIIASFNYILLTLTNTISRSQDVGVRKTIGADRKQIILQYYTETQLLALLSVIVGLLIAITCLPLFNTLTDNQINLSNISIADITVFIIILAVVLGCLAGIYPSFAMSGLRPLNMMRGFATYRISPVLSKSLIAIQFTICVVFIMSTMVIGKQMRFISNAKMGFDKDQVMLVQNPYGWDDTKDAQALKERLYHYVATQPSLAGITSTGFKFGGYNNNGHIINGKQVYVQEMSVDFNYFTFNKISILKGRNFSADFATDSAEIKLAPNQKIAKSSTVSRAVIVNETLYNMLGKPPLGGINRELGARIIGVCKDYHTDDLTKRIEPAYHRIATAYVGYYWIKIKTGQNIHNAVAKILSDWKGLSDNSVFTYTFMDEDVTRAYDSYNRWMKTINTSCIVAILIACLGLFGISGLTTLNRTKEIGIRKVLGASVTSLFLLLNRNTLLLALISFVVAAPIALYMSGQWLQNFAYHVKPGWLTVTAAGFIALATALLAVSYHTIKAAVLNPVKSLRNE